MLGLEPTQSDCGGPLLKHYTKYSAQWMIFFVGVGGTANTKCSVTCILSLILTATLRGKVIPLTIGENQNRPGLKFSQGQSAIQGWWLDSNSGSMAPQC